MNASMKTLSVALLAAGSIASYNASAAPITLPNNTPLYIQYNNAEQFSNGNNISANLFGGGTVSEGNWGVFQLTSIVTGTALSPTGSDIQGGGAPIFFDQVLPAGAQILGIFYGLTNIAVPGFGGTASVPAAGGAHMDFYYWDAGHALQNVGTELASGANLAKRTFQDEYTGFTCAHAAVAGCSFLGRLDFTTGVLPGAPGVVIQTPVTVGSVDGTSKSYLDVNTSKVGAWTNQLNTNFFTLDPCNNPVGYDYSAPGANVCPTTGLPTAAGGVSYTHATDVRLDTNFSRNGATAWDVANSDIIGLRSNDPGRTYSVIPEPGTLTLLGAGMMFAGRFNARRRAQG